MLLKITLQKNSNLQAWRFYWHFSALKTVLNSFGKGNKNVLFLILTFCSLNYSSLKRGCFWDCPTHGVNFSILFASPTGTPVALPLCRAPVLLQIELFIINQTVLLSSVSGQSGIWISCDGLFLLFLKCYWRSRIWGFSGLQIYGESTRSSNWASVLGWLLIPPCSRTGERTRRAKVRKKTLVVEVKTDLETEGK